MNKNWGFKSMNISLKNAILKVTLIQLISFYVVVTVYCVLCSWSSRFLNLVTVRFLHSSSALYRGLILFYFSVINENRWLTSTSSMSDMKMGNEWILAYEKLFLFSSHLVLICLHSLSQIVWSFKTLLSFSYQIFLMHTYCEFLRHEHTCRRLSRN